MSVFRLTVLSLLLTALLTATAAANPDLSATCTGDAITIEIHVQDTSSADDIVGLRVMRRTLGVCDSEIALNPDAPLAWPADGQALDHTLIDNAVEAHRGYVYSLRSVLVDGREFPIGYPFTWPVVTGCDGWGITRGVLPWNPDIYVMDFQPCECWYYAPILDLTALDPAVYQSLAGQIVEIRGAAYFDEMPGAPNVIVTEIFPVPSCDAPVPATRTSWSAVKSLYR